jgi:hypothetical protein
MFVVANRVLRLVLNFYYTGSCKEADGCNICEQLEANGFGKDYVNVLV